MENLVQVKNMTKRMKGFSLNNLNFDIKKGYITGFIGPNGAGKTTTIRCLMNLINIDRGQITLFGQTHMDNTKDIKQRIGFVFDENYYYEDLTIEQNKRVVAPFYENWSDERFYHYIKTFQLPNFKVVKHLSKGMKVKFALAMALAHDPQLIIMDEPTSGLDPVFRRELLDLLLDVMQDEEKAVFFSTHNTTDLDRVADFITFIHDGKIVFSDEKDAIFERYVLVKGAKQQLSDVKKLQLAGFKETEVGFEALITNRGEIPESLLETLMLEKPKLEDIMYYTARRDQFATAYY